MSCSVKVKSNGYQTEGNLVWIENNFESFQGSDYVANVKQHLVNDICIQKSHRQSVFLLNR